MSRHLSDSGRHWVAQVVEAGWRAPVVDYDDAIALLVTCMELLEAVGRFDVDTVEAICAVRDVIDAIEADDD